MTHDKIVTFWLALTWQALKATWTNRNWYKGNARHRVSYIGTNHGRSVGQILRRLEAERELEALWAV